MSINTDSIGKKGYGNGFVSRAKRFSQCNDKNSLDYLFARRYSSPGPGQYHNPEKSFSFSQTSTTISTPSKPNKLKLEQKSNSEKRL